MATIIFPPHIILRYTGKRKHILDEDQNRNAIFRHSYFKNGLFQFVEFMTFLPEYRSVFYKRIGLFGRFLNLFIHGHRNLYIYTDGNHIGSGFVVHHGHSTGINAKSIGKNCHVMQNVTLGTRKTAEGPTIGNNVFIGVGAIVLGDIKIGNNVNIGAGAVVVEDIPDNVTVVPQKPIILIHKKGYKNEKV